LLGLERGLGFDGVGANAENGYAEIVEFLFCVAKLGRLYRSTGSVGFWIKEEKDLLASEVLKGDGLAVVGLQAEGGGFGANFEHRNSFVLDLRGFPRMESGRSRPTWSGVNSGAPYNLRRSIR
jgi:hypothetical protein